MSESHNPNETSAGSLGLSEALAVAYDIHEDPNYAQSNFSHTNSNTTPSFQPAFYPKTQCYPSHPPAQQVRYQAGDPYWEFSYNQYVQSRHPNQSAVPMTAYLNPIPVPSATPANRVYENGPYYAQIVPNPTVPPVAMTPTNGDAPLNYVEGGPASESTMSTDSMLSVPSDNYPIYPPTSDMGYSIQKTTQPAVMPTNGTHNNSTSNGYGNSLPTHSNSNSRRSDDQRRAAVPSSGADDGLVELTEEEILKIDNMVSDW